MVWREYTTTWLRQMLLDEMKKTCLVIVLAEILVQVYGCMLASAGIDTFVTMQHGSLVMKYHLRRTRGFV